MLQVGDWVGITTLIVGVAGAAFAAYWQAGKKAERAAPPERELSRRAQELRLSDRDRELLERHRDSIDEHRRAIEDHAAVLGRSSPTGRRS